MRFSRGLVSLALAGMLAACGGSATSSTVALGSDTTPSDVERSGFGKIVAVADRGTSITVELAEMLSGDQARDAAIEDGVIAEGEDLPNDFYIRPLDTTETLQLAEDAVISLQGLGVYQSPTPTVVDAATFQAAFNADFAPPEWYGGEYFEFTATGDTVTALEQIYLP